MNKKIVIFSIYLNHHQASIADILYRILGDRFVFVELLVPKDNKGSTESFSERPYLLQAWSSAENYSVAMSYAETSEVCIFSGVQSLPFEKRRMELNLLSFDMSERWLKRGGFSLLSPRVQQLLLSYHIGHWRKKKLYCLCCSAFAKQDFIKLFMYPDKCFKWGYFTKVNPLKVDTVLGDTVLPVIPIMWCARLIKLKHPELPILLAERLKKDGYSFVIDMYGEGEMREKLQKMIQQKHLSNYVRLLGTVPNDILLEKMREHRIFLFTSNKREGWGAVANEAMSSKCCLVASDCIGSTPYLIKDGLNGMAFKSGSLDSLCCKVEYLLNNMDACIQMGENGYKQMIETWSPEVASRNLLQLIQDLKSGKGTSIEDGPCSLA